MSFNCPVCNKAGLSDYKATNIVCPQCNSDLSPYKVLYSASQTTSPKSRNRILLPVSIVAITTIILCVYFNERSIKNQTSKPQAVALVKIDSTNYYKEQLRVQENRKNETPVTEVEIKYIIKKGDCLSKIASIFYGDWKQFKKIESDNNLQKPYNLIPGEKLIIKVSVQ